MQYAIEYVNGPFATMGKPNKITGRRSSRIKVRCFHSPELAAHWVEIDSFARKSVSKTELRHLLAGMTNGEFDLFVAKTTR